MFGRHTNQLAFKNLWSDILLDLGCVYYKQQLEETWLLIFFFISFNILFKNLAGMGICEGLNLAMYYVPINSAGIVDWDYEWMSTWIQYSTSI